MKVLTFCFSMIVLAVVAARGQVSDFVETDFSRADSVGELYPNYPLNNLTILSYQLTKSLSTDQEKFRAIFKWVCNNIENDYPLYLKNKHKKESCKTPEELIDWNKKFSAIAFKTLIENHRTVCSGYAYVIRELAERAGLACTIINGYGRTIQANIKGNGTPNHSWNGVKLNDKWYLCDATWSSGAYDRDQSTFVKNFDAAYFLSDPAMFVRNHYPLDSTWMLLSEQPTLQEFLNAPVVYKGAFAYSIYPLKNATLDITATKGERVLFQFTRDKNKLIGKAELRIDGSAKRLSVTPSISQDTTGRYLLEHTFTARGDYHVHILLDDNYAFTYNVKVL
jgi:transglutaminase/protease-like cytokinesis protein 3